MALPVFKSNLTDEKKKQFEHGHSPHVHNPREIDMSVLEETNMYPKISAPVKKKKKGKAMPVATGSLFRE